MKIIGREESMTNDDDFNRNPRERFYALVLRVISR
jgi:hypothetical protein